MRIWLLLTLLLVPAVHALSLTVTSPITNSVVTSIQIRSATDVIANISAYVNGALVGGPTEGTELNVTPFLTDNTYTISINATAGNITDSVELQNVTVDNSTPSVNIVSPTSTSKFIGLAGGSVNITFTVSDANLQAATLSLMSGSIVLNSTSVIAGGVVELGIPDSASGTLTLNLSAVDAAGNAAEDLEAAVDIDDTAATVSISSPISKVFTRGEFTVDYTYTENDPQNVIISLMNVSGVVDSTTISISASGTQQRSDTVSLGVGDGLYQINVTVVDLNGNEGTAISGEFVVVDNTKPFVNFTLSDISVNVNDTITPKCDATDNSEQWGGTLNITISGIDTSYSNRKTATCRVEDSAGNIEIDLVEYEVLIASQQNNTTQVTTQNNTTTTTNITISSQPEQTLSAEERAEEIRRRLESNKAAEAAAQDLKATAEKQEAESAVIVEEVIDTPKSKKTWAYVISGVGILALIVIGALHFRKPGIPKITPSNEPVSPNVLIKLKKGPDITKDEE